MRARRMRRRSSTRRSVCYRRLRPNRTSAVAQDQYGLRSGVVMSDRAPAVDPRESAHAIRRARPADFAAVRRLYRVVQDTHAAHLPELFRASADDDFSAEYFDTVLEQHLVLVAERAGDIVGSLHAHLCEMSFGSNYIPHRSLFINHVVTDPALRRGGIAHASIAASA